MRAKITPRRPSRGLMTTPLIELRALQIAAWLLAEPIEKAEARIAEPGLPEPIPGAGPMEPLAEAAAEGLVPLVLRRQLILSLYTVLEQTILGGVEILDRFHEGEPFDGTRDLLTNAQEHIKRHLAYDLFEPLADPRPVWVFNRLRRAIVHGAGSRFLVKPKLWRQLEDDRRQFGGFTLDRNFINLEPNLFERLHGPVLGLMHGFVERVRLRVDEAGELPPPRQQVRK